MIKRSLSLLLMILLTFVAAARAAGQASTTQASDTEKIKSKVARLGVGEKARAQVKLRTGEKIKGYVSRAGETDFVITDKKTAETKTFLYADVLDVKKPGGLSTAAKIGIGVGIGVAVLAIVFVYAKNHLFDDFRLGQ